MNPVKKILFPVFIYIFPFAVAGQSTANYTFNSVSNASLADMSSGTSDILTPGTYNGDVASSPVSSIGFEFWFMGTKYTQFSVNSNGLMRLGGTVVSNDFSNDLNSTADLPMITAFWDDLNQNTGLTSKVHSKVTGSSPNQVLTIEWKDFIFVYNASTNTSSNFSTFQVRLYETTGVIEFVYGAMVNSTGTTNSTIASIGFSNGNSNNSLLSVTSISTPAVTTATASVNDLLVNNSTDGAISGLSSSSDGSRVKYSFTPPIPVAPTGLTFTSVTASGMTLNWNDNSSNEVKFAIYNSTDGSSYSYVNTVAANTSTYAASGLSCGTTYYWKVYAVSEGGFSNVVSGNQSTVNNFSNYSFSASSGTYSYLTSPVSTLIDVTQDEAWADNSDAGVDIGFDFWYLGTKYTKFGVSSNGWMALGATSVNLTVATAINNLSSGGTVRPIIAPLWDDLKTGTAGSGGKVQYELQGISPNRILVVEWLNMRWQWSSSDPCISFQAKLYENTGTIQFVYKPETYGTITPSASIGICGPSTGCGNFISVDATSSTSSPATSFSSETTSNGTKPASGQTYTFGPPVPAAPTGLTFSAITTTGMTLNWTDNSTNEMNFDIWYSTDNSSFTELATVPSTSTNSTGTTYNYAATGLICGTTYYWKVYSISDGAFSNELAGSQATNNAPSPGTYSVGPTGNYASIGAALTAIGCVGSLTGNYIFEFQSTYVSTVETFPLSITYINPGTGNYTVTFRPASGVTGRTITSSNTTATISMSGAVNIIFDGRQGGTGTNQELTISNSAVTSTGYSIQLLNDANNNIFRYCKIYGNGGANTATSATVVYFGTTTGTLGNDYNNFSNCDLGKNANDVVNIVYSSGTSGIDNDNNTFSGCTIHDFYKAATAHQGIYISSNNTDWVISDNSFYTTTASITGTAAVSSAIKIDNTSGNNFTISGNYIGGQSASAGGSPWTVSTGSSTTYTFIGINLNVGTTTASSVQNNIIKNFSWNSSSTSTSPGVWCGINITAGNVNVGTSTGNTIGSNSGTGSVSSRVTVSSGLVTGINSSGTGTISINNNNIGSITTTTSSASVVHGIVGIQISGASGTITISGNIIGTTSTANSINASAAAGSTTTVQQVSGISSSNGGTLTISGNTIANINNAHTAAVTTNEFVGIETTSGTNTISSNTLYNFSSPSTGTGLNATTTANACLNGISQTSTAAAVQTIDHNVIYSLTNSASTANVEMAGIYFTGSTSVTNVVKQNIIHTISTTSTGTGVNVNGIEFDGGKTDYFNNMIRMGIDASGGSQTTPFIMRGIRQGGNATGTTNIYYNSIYIGGAGVSNSTNNSACYRRSNVTSGTVNIKNNIFFNARSNTSSGQGKHYAILLYDQSGTVNCDYNDLFISGTDGYIGSPNNGTTNHQTFANWKTGTGYDANSINITSGYKVPAGTTATVDLHIDPMVCNVAEKGVSINGYSTDIDDENRSGASGGTVVSPDLGADEFGGNISNAGSVAACSGFSTSITLSSYETGTIKWQYSNSNSNYSWVDVLEGTDGTGSTSAIFTSAALSSTKYYRAAITNGSCISHSNEVAVSISTGVPGNPTGITGNTNPCLGSTNTYTIVPNPVSGTNITYNWSVPSGATINSGSGTVSISVTLGSVSGNVDVYASNPCGNSTTYSSTITVGGSGTWKGTVSTNWGTASNWCGNAVPLSTTDVIIPSGTPFSPYIDSRVVSGKCKDITINSGATLRVENSANCASNGIGWGTAGNGYLIVYGNILNNGTFIQKEAVQGSKYCLLYNILEGSGKTISGTGSYQIVSASGYFQGPAFALDANSNYSLSNDWPYSSSEFFGSLYVFSGSGGDGTLNLSNYNLSSNLWQQYGIFNSNTGTLTLAGNWVSGITNYVYNTSKSTWGTNSLLKIKYSNVNLILSDQDDYYNVEYNPTSGKYFQRSSNLDLNGYFKITTGEARGSSYSISLKGDWINNGTFTSNTSTINMNGTTGQNITGSSSTIFNNLTINNTISGNGGVTVLTNSTVTGLLTLTDGHLISPASGRMTLGSSATVSPSNATGSGQSGSFISGYLNRNTSTTSGITYDFPMGDSPSGTWRPLNITTQDANGRTWTCQMVKSDPVVDIGSSSILSGELLTGLNDSYYYNLSPNTTPATIDLKMYYAASDQPGYDESDLIIGHWCDATCGQSKWNNWSKNNLSTDWASSSANDWVQVKNISTFSPVGVGHKNTPLPIELLSFTAQPRNNMVQINWETAMEINCDYFEIERSRGTGAFENLWKWEPVIKVQGAGTSSSPKIYSEVDKNPLRGISYYRLKEVDVDGNFFNSIIAKVNLNEKENPLLIFTNPANKTLDVFTDSPLILLNIWDVAGKKILEKHFDQPRSGILSINISFLSEGMYFISTYDGTQTQWMKFVKEGK